MNVNDLLQAEKAIAPAYRSYNGGYFKTLLSPAQTGGEMALLDMVLPRGAEPPPHVHEREDETFYILDGTVQFVVDGVVHTLTTGAALFAPRRIPHYFRILTDSAHILALMTPGDLWNYFIEFSEPGGETPRITVPQPPTPEQIQYLAERLSDRYRLSLII
ncbi:hypothetical protein GCM10023091_29540 [Ravibacter arvi]|uniref:Cupin type-2 domain-containing protein n=1 Tax=Ravibacter arvi TaxID=2051041 RepID=A0ABP8M1G0_9BACT